MQVRWFAVRVPQQVSMGYKLALQMQMLMRHESDLPALRVAETHDKQHTRVHTDIKRPFFTTCKDKISSE